MLSSLFHFPAPTVFSSREVPEGPHPSLCVVRSLEIMPQEGRLVPRPEKGYHGRCRLEETTPVADVPGPQLKGHELPSCRILQLWDASQTESLRHSSQCGFLSHRTLGWKSRVKVARHQLPGLLSVVCGGAAPPGPPHSSSAPSPRGRKPGKLTWGPYSPTFLLLRKLPSAGQPLPLVELLGRAGKPQKFSAEMKEHNGL